MTGRGMIVFVASCALAATMVGAQKKAPEPDEDMAQYLPPGAGKALVVEECTACHELDRVVKLRKSKADWKAVMQQMVEREGAEFSAAKMETMATYLGAALGPTAPPLVDVNKATREELVKVTGITPEMAARLLEQRKARGSFASRDEVQAALGVDNATFDTIKWYLRTEKKPWPATR